MANAIHDQNTGLTLLCASSADSVTPINIEADPTTKGINVQIVGDDVGVGGGTQYTEDVATASPQVGKAIMMERDDQLAAVAPAEGDWIGLRGTSKGALWVSLADASGDPITSFGGGTQYDDGDAEAAPTGTVALGTDGSNVFALNCDTNGNLQVDLVTAAVTNAGTFVVQEDGAALTALQLIDDPVATISSTPLQRVAIFDDSDTQITSFGGGTEYVAGTDVYTEDTTAIKMVGAVRNDTLATLADTDNDLAPLQVNASGALYIDVANGGVLEGLVDGIETVLGTIDTDTSNMATSLGNLDNAVDGNYLNVNMNIAGTDVVGGSGVLAAGVQRVTIATDDEVNNLLGTIDADTGNIATYTAGAETALEKIDGAVVGPGEPTIDSYTQFAINLNAGANQVLVSSAANKQIWVYAVAYTCSVAGTVSFQDQDDNAVTGIMDHAAKSGIAIGSSGNFAMPIWKLATDKDLEVDVVDAAIDGWIDYAIVSV